MKIKAGMILMGGVMVIRAAILELKGWVASQNWTLDVLMDDWQVPHSLHYQRDISIVHTRLLPDTTVQTLPGCTWLDELVHSWALRSPFGNFLFGCKINQCVLFQILITSSFGPVGRLYHILRNSLKVFLQYGVHKMGRMDNPEHTSPLALAGTEA